MKFYYRRPAMGVTATCLAAVLLSACMANPGDAPTVEGQEAPEQVQPDTKDREQQLREITIGVDEFVEGFNPHLIADSSPLTDLISSLTLPSAFVADPQQPGQLVQNEDLLDAVSGVDQDGKRFNGNTDKTTAVTSVRYIIKRGAQWSDGTPISGEDFRYLYTKLTSTPAVARAASYGLIKNLDVSDGGRQVDIEFREPVSDWRELFRNILPAHLLRSSTDSFNEVLDTVLPASGSRYTVQSLDVGRNIVRLVRNDRFWGAHPAVTETVVIRAVRNSVDGAAQLRTDQLQAVQVRPQETTALTYSLVPSAVEFTQRTSRQLTLTANVASPTLADASVRRNILDRVNVAQIRAVATGRAEDSVPNTAAANSAETTESSAAPTPQELTGIDSTSPLRIGVISGDSQALAAAYAIADQLSASGLPAEVTKTSPTELTRSWLPYGLVDFVVSWAEKTGTVASARDRYLCPSSSLPSLEPKEELAQRSKEKSTVSSNVPSASAEETDQRDKAAVAPKATARTGNLSGLCLPELDKLLGAGQTSFPESARQLVEQQAIELPLVSDEVLTVIGSGVTRESEPDPKTWGEAPYIGKLVTLPVWQRVLPTVEQSTVSGKETDVKEPDPNEPATKGEGE